MKMSPQACRSNRAGSKARAYARGSLASKRAQQNTGGVDTILGTVTPKRGAANNGGNLEDILNTAVLRTPDGKQYGFTNLGGVSNSFFTAASSPADFDFQNATPTTAANMIAVSIGPLAPGLSSRLACSRARANFVGSTWESGTLASLSARLPLAISTAMPSYITLALLSTTCPSVPLTLKWLSSGVPMLMFPMCSMIPRSSRHRWRTRASKPQAQSLCCSVSNRFDCQEYAEALCGDHQGCRPRPDSHIALSSWSTFFVVGSCFSAA